MCYGEHDGDGEKICVTLIVCGKMLTITVVKKVYCNEQVSSNVAVF